jgi:predicted DCC family thiol-disulfide oxidoreductase YuxK
MEIELHIKCVRDAVGDGELEKALEEMESLFHQHQASPDLIDELISCRGSVARVRKLARQGRISLVESLQEQAKISNQILELLRDFEKSAKRTQVVPSTKLITDEDVVITIIQKFPLPARYLAIQGFERLFRDAVWRVVKEQRDATEFLESLSEMIPPNEAKQLLIQTVRFIREISRFR